MDIRRRYPSRVFSIFFILFILPALDMATGKFLNLGYLHEGGFGSPSQLGRFVGIFFVISVYFRFKVTKVFVFCVFLVFLFELILGVLSHNNFRGVMFGLLSGVRFVSLILFYRLFKEVYRKFPLFFSKCFIFHVYFITLSMIFAFVTQTGISTYGWGWGTRGYFASGNGIGVYIGVATLIGFHLFNCFNLQYKEIKILLFMLTSIVALILLGTKTSVIFSFILLVSVTLHIKALRFILFLSLPLLINSIGGGFLKLFDLFSVLSSRYAQSESFSAFIFSGRDDYVSNAFAVFFNSDPSIFRYIFGAGAYASYQDVRNVIFFDTLETDLFDIFFMYGLFGASIYLLIFLILFLRGWRYPFVFLPSVLLFSHSLFAGHVLQNGLVCLLVPVLFAIAQDIGDRKWFL